MREMFAGITYAERWARWEANAGGVCDGRCYERPITPQPTPCHVPDWDEGHDETREYSGGKHRRAWEAVYGPIPAGLFCCHKCDNPRCFNVEHLFLGTHRENIQDAAAKGRMSFRRKHREGPPPVKYESDERIAVSDMRACSVICRHCDGFIRQKPAYMHRVWWDGYYYWKGQRIKHRDGKEICPEPIKVRRPVGRPSKQKSG